MESSASVPTDGSPVATAGLDDAPGGEVDVGILVANTPRAEPDPLRRFATQMARDAAEELTDATDVAWRFYVEEPTHLPDASDRRPTEFLDEATHRMVEGPYDVVVVLTDALLRSSRERFVPGLASELSRVAVVSIRQLRRAPRGEPRRPMDAPALRWNGATLFVHLLGHVLGAGHQRNGDGVMAPFRFDPERRRLPTFDAAVGPELERIVEAVPADAARSRDPLRRLEFYASTALRHPGDVGRALVRSKAPLLPLSLPKLSTAALTPTLVIVFSAEAWDVGFHLDDLTAAVFAVTSVVAAAVYVLFIQNLSFPRKRHRVITEHSALVNVTVFLVLVGAMAGLFALVGTIILAIQLVVFPPNLMSNWPSLEDPTIGLVDLVRTAAFISTVGVLSGALAGGLENRTIVRHLTLFRDTP
jgi:predicted Zn-dependent protease